MISLLDPKLHIRSALHAKTLVLAGILMSVTYKIGKYLLWSEFKIDPTDDTMNGSFTAQYTESSVLFLDS